MFSARLPWDAPSNRLSQALARRRQSGAEILDLTESNPTRAGLAYPPEILTALADARALLYEPAPAGLEAARAAVAAYYAARGRTVKPDRILLTASTSEAYAFLFKLLADPGDEVLVPRPSYPLFDYLAALESVRVRQYPLFYQQGWFLDAHALEAALTARTRAIIVVSPNNPTGSFLKRRELDHLLALCARHSLALVADEVFSDYAFAPDPERVSTLAGCDEALTFTLSGLSKIAGLPQLKLAWIVVGGPAELRRRALERIDLIADTYLSVAAPVQHALPRLLDYGALVREQITARVRSNLETLSALCQGRAEGDRPTARLRSRLSEDPRAQESASEPRPSGSGLGPSPHTLCREPPACELLAVEGGWYAILRVPRTRSEEEWTLELLERDGVLVQPGFFFDFDTEAYLVLSLLTPSVVFAEGAQRLLARLTT